MTEGNTVGNTVLIKWQTYFRHAGYDYWLPRNLKLSLEELVNKFPSNTHVCPRSWKGIGCELHYTENITIWTSSFEINNVQQFSLQSIKIWKSFTPRANNSANGEMKSTTNIFGSSTLQHLHGSYTPSVMAMGVKHTFTSMLCVFCLRACNTAWKQNEPHKKMYQQHLHSMLMCTKFQPNPSKIVETVCSTNFWDKNQPNVKCTTEKYTRNICSGCWKCVPCSSAIH